MEAKAVAKYVRMSPIKLKPVTDLVRGKDLNEALTILKLNSYPYLSLKGLSTLSETIRVPTTLIA